MTYWSGKTHAKTKKTTHNRSCRDATGWRRFPDRCRRFVAVWCVGLFQSKILRLKHSPVRSTGTIENEAAFSHPGYIIIMIFFVLVGERKRKFQVATFFSRSLLKYFIFFIFGFVLFFSFLIRELLTFFYLSLVALLALFGRQRDLAICRTAKVGWTLASSTSTTTTTTQSPRESSPPESIGLFCFHHSLHSLTTHWNSVQEKKKEIKNRCVLANVVLLVGRQFPF